MANALGLGPSILRQGLLRGLIGPGAPHESFPDDELAEALLDATSSVEQDLSTRFRVTTFRSHPGPGPAPAPRGADDVEAPYPWPSPLPGEGFIRLQTRVRPVIEVLGMQIVLPGAVGGRVEIPSSWFRLDSLAGEVVLMPSLGGPALAFGLPLAFPALFASRLPQSLLLTYRAGLGAAGLARWPKLRRLVLLRAALQILPALAPLANPGFLTSLSADGLSQSRASGYAFKDLEERLSGEADALKGTFLDLWDGPALGML